MALERYGFFNSATEDARVYDADALSAALRALTVSGVSALDSTNLKVTAEGSTLRTLVGYGSALLRGYHYELRDDGSGVMAFTHASTVGADRIDRIVVQLDLTARTIAMIKKEGVASSTPAAPALTRTANVYEISLAQVRVRASASELLPTDVTDERANEAVCGAALPEGVTLSRIWDRMAKPNATPSVPGMMSAADKASLDKLNAALTPTVTVDGEMTTKKVDCNDYEVEGAKDFKTTGGVSLAAVKAAADALDAGKADLDENSKVAPAQASSRIVTVSASKTLALTDAGTLQLVSGGHTLTVRAHGTVAFPVGTEMEITQYGTDPVTVAAAAGITILSLNASLKTIGRYAGIGLKKVDTNTWLLQGGLSM